MTYLHILYVARKMRLFHQKAWQLLNGCQWRKTQRKCNYDFLPVGFDQNKPCIYYFKGSFLLYDFNFLKVFQMKLLSKESTVNIPSVLTVICKYTFQVNEADFQLKLINPNTNFPLHSTQLRRPDEI